MSNRKRVMRHGPRAGVLSLSIGAIIASGGVSSAAFGQDEEEETDSQQDTIIVTGTRIRRDDFSAAQATTVITAQDMEALGVVSVADMVNQLPNNIASVSPEATADSPFYLGASIANMRGLNTAYGVRTLTLLDSRRVTPTNNGGGVDMNFIPSALVGRIETVTGGASATYGADAMAGVVNVILDDSIENIRVDLSYNVNGEGDGDQYNLSLGTGFQFFENNRGNLTIGLDSSRQDGIEDCTTHPICQRGLGLFRNGEQNASTNLASMYTTRTDGSGGDGNIIFRGQPEWVLQEGHRYTTTTTGVTMGDGGYPCATIAGGVVDTSNCLTPEDYEVGWYNLNEAGTDLVPYMTPEQVTEQQLLGIYSVGTQTGIGISYQGDGNRWSTPWGLGRSIYEDVPIMPTTDRDNLFMRFTYELEGGIELGADLTYGQTRSESAQNGARNNLQQFCVMPNNAYLQPQLGTGQLLRDVFAARTGFGVSSGAFAPFGNDIGCRQAPFLGTVLRFRETDELVSDANRTDLPPGMVFDKDFGGQIDHRNINDSDSASLTFTANGSLFEGGSWTWDAYLQFGETTNRQTLSGWRAGRRWDMALDSVIDGYDTDGDGEIDVPLWNMPDPDDPDGWTENPQPDGSTPVVVCSIDSMYNAALDNSGNNNTPGELVNWGDFIRLRWQDYLALAIDDELTQEDIDDVYAELKAGCTPFNPFGNQAMTPEQQSYVFPTLFEGTDNEQTAFSLSFSGDAWRGIGNAGPMRMAAGIDWRQNDTQNYTDKSRFLGADYNFIGTSSSGQDSRRIYGDNWWGRTETEEAWVEFDLPLLRDRPGVDSLVFNTSFRRTENSTQRISGLSNVTTRDETRTIDSWKASMQWQPVDIMRVRMTRSADTRAPSANELFATNSFVLETSGQQEVDNPWRFYAGGMSWEDRDQITVLEAGNASLEAERSVTETLGIVFQPVDAIPGLQVSVDYYQTVIEGGIQEIDEGDTISACFTEISGNGRWGEIPFVPVEDHKYCGNILFGDPDPTQEFFPLPPAAAASESPFGAQILGPDGVTPVTPGTMNPYYDYTNIVSVAKSTINQEDITSRGIDYSVSYFTQLNGGGSINARALFTRFLEQQVFLGNTFGPIDVSGQTGGNNIANYFGTFSTNYSPTPRIRGNLFMTYSKNAFSVTAQARYTGTGALSKQNGWLGPGDATWWTLYLNDEPFTDQDYPIYQAYDPDVERTITDSDTPSWTTLNLNFSYDFGRSRFQMDRFESLSAYLNIENIGDRVPTFFSGTGAGGINSSLYSAMGRQYRMGVRMEF